MDIRDIGRTGEVDDIESSASVAVRVDGCFLQARLGLEKKMIGCRAVGLDCYTRATEDLWRRGETCVKKFMVSFCC